MKAALIAVSALAGVLAIALVAVVLGGDTVSVGGLPELENEGDAPPPKEDGPTRRIQTEINDGSGWKDVDLEVELLEARTANPSREDTLGIEKPDHRWIAAEFEVRNRGDDATNDTLSLTAIDTAGQTHGPDGVPVIAPGLDQVNVPPGSTRKGFLSVQVPDDARIERIETSVIAEPLGWDLDRPL